jgi:hypothetical protein
MVGCNDQLFLEKLYGTKLPHLSRLNNHTQEFSPNEYILTIRKINLCYNTKRWHNYAGLTTHIYYSYSCAPLTDLLMNVLCVHHISTGGHPLKRKKT